jgi:hypothetical protein
MSNSWWRRVFPLRFYRSQVCYSEHASHAWYVEWRGRGWSIEVTPVGPHLWQPDLSVLSKAGAAVTRREHGTEEG